MKSLEVLCKLARKLGAVEAKVISPQTVVTAPWVRWKCQYGCSGYDGSLTCPPHSPAPEETAEVLREYKKAILIHAGDHGDVSEIAVKVEKEAFLSGYYKAFGLGSGPCRLCPSCDVAADCRKPEKARPSMEAAGIDVFRTIRNNQFKIEVLKSPGCKGNYFGLVLIT